MQKMTGGEKTKNLSLSQNLAVLPFLAVARSRRGSDSPQDCHSLPRRASLPSSEGAERDIPYKPCGYPRFFLFQIPKVVFHIDLAVGKKSNALAF